MHTQLPKAVSAAYEEKKEKREKRFLYTAASAAQDKKQKRCMYEYASIEYGDLEGRVDWLRVESLLPYKSKFSLVNQ